MEGYCGGVIWPLDLTSRLGIALGEPRPFISYIDWSKAFKVFNNSSDPNRYTIFL